MDIKICGISTIEALDTAIEAGATHFGMVHFDKSPRHVSLDQARALRDHGKGRIKSVLLLVNQQPLPTGQAIEAVQPDVIQFHGREAPDWVGIIREKLPMQVWKARGVKDRGSLDKANEMYAGKVDRIVYDGVAGALPGGNGTLFDWSLLADYPHRAPWILAGGLTPENVAEGIRTTGADFVDASSGIESEPGVKDHGKIRAFCQAALEAA